MKWHLFCAFACCHTHMLSLSSTHTHTPIARDIFRVITIPSSWAIYRCNSKPQLHLPLNKRKVAKKKWGKRKRKKKPNCGKLKSSHSQLEATKAQKPLQSKCRENRKRSKGKGLKLRGKGSMRNEKKKQKKWQRVDCKPKRWIHSQYFMNMNKLLKRVRHEKLNL